MWYRILSGLEFSMVHVMPFFCGGIVDYSGWFATCLGSLRSDLRAKQWYGTLSYFEVFWTIVTLWKLKFYNIPFALLPYVCQNANMMLWFSCCSSWLIFLNYFFPSMFATWSLSEWGTIVSYNYCSLSKVLIRFYLYLSWESWVASLNRRF